MKAIISTIVLIVFLSDLSFPQTITQQWVVYPSPQSINTINVKENQLYIDDGLNVYAGGVFYDTAYFYNSLATVKINSAGTIQWYATDAGPGVVSAVLSAISVDSLFNVYMSGSINENSGIGFARTNKYDQNGTLIWTHQLDTTNGTLGTRSYGNFVSTDNFIYEHVRQKNITISKLDTLGNVILQFTNDTIDATQNQAFIASEFKRDLENNIYVAGTYINTPNPNERKYFVKKFNSQGIFLWEAFYNPTFGSDNLTDLYIDSMQNVYLNGIENVNNGYGIVVYDSTGSEKWNSFFQNNGAGYADDIVADNFGNCYVNGIAPDASTYMGFLLKYDTVGNVLWQRNIDSVSANSLAKIKLDADANVYVTYSGSNNIISVDYVVTAKFDSSGNLKWKMYFNQPLSVTALSLDMSNNVYIAGEGFIIKYSQSTGTNEILYKAEEIKIYPNPVTNNIISFSRYLNLVTLSIFDSFGREIIKYKKFSGKSLLLPQKLQAGLYFIEILDEKKLFINKIVID